MSKSKMYSQEQYDIALLSQKQDQIFQTLVRIADEIKDFRHEVKEFRSEMKDELRHIKLWSWSQFVFLFGALAALSAVTAHGFHWF